MLLAENSVNLPTMCLYEEVCCHAAYIFHIYKSCPYSVCCPRIYGNVMCFKFTNVARKMKRGLIFISILAGI